MNKFQKAFQWKATDHSSYDWPIRPVSSQTKKHYTPPNKEKAHSSNGSTGKEQYQKDMIRDLQGIFCKGRYRSWIFTKG